MLKISERTGIRAVASNDCHYMHKDDCRAHDILLCIQTGKTVNDPNRMKFYTDQFYFKNRQEMDRVFGEIPYVLDQTVEIAERCNLKLQKVDNPFPEFEVPPGFTIDSYFAKVVRDGFQDRLEHLKPLSDSGALKNPIEAYEKRIDDEIRIIQGMKYPGYFLIVWDLIRYAQGARASRSARAAVRRQAAWCRTACGSRTLIRCSTACSSNASSTRNA